MGGFYVLLYGGFDAAYSILSLIPPPGNISYDHLLILVTKRKLRKIPRALILNNSTLIQNNSALIPHLILLQNIHLVSKLLPKSLPIRGYLANSILNNQLV